MEADSRMKKTIWGQFWSAHQVINPLYADLSMHILHTVLCTFPVVLMGESLYQLTALLSW